MDSKGQRLRSPAASPKGAFAIARDIGVADDWLDILWDTPLKLVAIPCLSDVCGVLPKSHL